MLYWSPFFTFSVQSNILYTFIISINIHLLFNPSNTVLPTLSSPTGLAWLSEFPIPLYGAVLFLQYLRESLANAF